MKEHKHPLFTAVLITIAKIWKQPKCPSIHAWKTLWDIYTTEYYLAINVVTAWVDLENMMPSEISQRKTTTVRFHLYVESNEQTGPTGKIQTHRWRAGRQLGGVGGRGWRDCTKRKKESWTWTAVW